MSSYGLKIWDSLGNLKLNTNERLARLVYSTVVGKTESGNVTLPDIEDYETVEFGICLMATASSVTGSAPHVVTRDGTTISWAVDPDPNRDYIAASPTLILVFMYT